ncbi:Alpha/beta hydrolase fold-3 [Cadophora sp. DSE1049]|nr:Alpha/beta hydrolase fold-3 [Cadophora sp. DSE1049]
MPMYATVRGGGFCLGGPESEEQTCRNFVQAFGATCISASYRLAPQFKFPQAPRDAWDCLKWAAANAKSWGANTSVGFVIGGKSAGANITAVLAHLARDEKLYPPLTGQYMAIPPVLPNAKVPEKYQPYAQNKNAPVFPVAAIEMFFGGYEPDEDGGVYFATFNHPKGHKDLPPAFLQVKSPPPPTL